VIDHHVEVRPADCAHLGALAAHNPATGRDSVVLCRKRNGFPAPPSATRRAWSVLVVVIAVVAIFFLVVAISCSDVDEILDFPNDLLAGQFRIIQLILQANRSRTLAPGALQSVGRIGSHTANTTTELSAYFFRIASTAEDPRRQVGQVGDINRMTRVFEDSWLKSVWSWASTFVFISVRVGGSAAWPVLTEIPKVTATIIEKVPVRVRVILNLWNSRHQLGYLCSRSGKLIVA
jgi:hypothetical protein